MAITAPVSMSKIVAEFGGPGNLREYTRGGPYVPNIAADGSISMTSANLRLSQYLGATNRQPLSGSLSGFYKADQDHTNPMPPGLKYVTAFGQAHVSGGTGNYSYSWSITSGMATITNNSGSGITIGATVNNWGMQTGNVRCIVSDGSSSITLNRAYTLTYEAGMPP